MALRHETYEEKTTTWLDDLSGKTKGSYILELATDEYGSRREGIAAIVQLLAPEQVAEPRQESLGEWLDHVRFSCSQRYAELKTASEGVVPAPTRQELNEDPLLHDMNAIQLGLRRAMADEQSRAAARNRLPQAAMPPLQLPVDPFINA